MKTRYILALAASVMLGMSSCSDDTESYGSNEVQLNVTVGSGTRTQPHVQGAEALQFSEGDILKVEADGQTASYMYTAERQWKAQGTPLLWIKTPMPVKAVYPATASYDSFDVPADQSTVEKIASADYMTYDNPAAQNAGDGILNIEMHRQVARVIINTQYNDEYNGTVPTIKQIFLSACGSVGGTALQKYTPYVSGSTYTAIVGPTAADAAAMFIKIVVSEESGEFRAFDINGIRQLEAGASYTFNVKVGKGAAHITGVTLDPWTDGTLPGGEDIDAERPLQVDASKNLVKIITPGVLTADAITKAMNGTDKLAISGPMNSTDFKVLRIYMGGTLSASDNNISQSKIKELDLSGVNVVKGGESYYSISLDSYSIVEDNQLGDYVFDSVNSALRNFPPIRKITLPATLKTIGSSAFYSCGVDEIVIPEGVETLNSNSFQSSSIKSINIPSTVKTIGHSALHKCNNLKRVEIPEGVETIEDKVLAHNPNLEYVSLPSTITSLGVNFEECNALTTLKLFVEPTVQFNISNLSTVASNIDLYLNYAWKCNEKLDIATNTFNGTKFKSITIYNPGIDIDNTKNLLVLKKAGILTNSMITEAMNGTDKLAISGPMNGTDFKVLREFMGSTLEANSSPEESIIKELDLSGVNVVKGGEPYIIDIYGEQKYITEDNCLGPFVFYYINSEHSPIRKIILPKTLKTIGIQALYACNVDEIILNEGLEYLNDQSLSSTHITSIHIPSTVRTIGQLVFGRCDNLTRIEVPEGVEMIHYGAIRRQNNLEYVSIPSTVTRLLTYNFNDCPKLTTLQLLVKTTATVDLSLLPEKDAARIDLRLNKEWKDNADFDLGTRTFMSKVFKSITLVNLDGTPAQ